MNFQESEIYSPKNVSFLKNTEVKRDKLFGFRKQRYEQVQKNFDLKKQNEKHTKNKSREGIQKSKKQKSQNFNDRTKRKQKFFEYEYSGQRMFNEFEDFQNIQFYSIVGELKQIQGRQKELRKWMGSFLVWVTIIVLLVLIFYILLLKTLFFFDNQLVATIIQSFKDQLFDPKITNDELQLEIFYIEQGCFILTVIVLFLFILTFTTIVSKYYQKRVQKYRSSKIMMKNLKERKDQLLKKIKTFTLTDSDR